MTLLDRILARGPEFPGDPVITARIERHLRRVQPDPLFRRRLRSVVVNRYVATREGLAMPATARPVMRRQMGMLGRGVLYASLLTTMAVTAVGAASQDSLPGDALYGVKLELEQVRMQLAPAALRDDLAAMALDKRLDEVEALASAGRWELVDDAANRATQAGAALASLAPSANDLSALAGEDAAQRHAQRLAELVRTAPALALDGLQRALAASTAPHPSNGNANSGGGGPSRQNHANQGQPPSPNGMPHDPRGNQARENASQGSGSQGNEPKGNGNETQQENGKGGAGQPSAPTSGPGERSGPALGG